MTLLETVLTELQAGNNILLFVILIILFVVGYKLLQAVIRIGLISVLSGVFLVVMDFIGLGPKVTVERFILFMVLGTGLFILYSSVATVFTVLDVAYGLVTRTLRWAFHSEKKPKKNWKKKFADLKEKVEKEEKKEKKKVSKAASKEKEIVLGELTDEE